MRPEAFQHDLAKALAVFALCRKAVGWPTEAVLAANVEAIEALREPFLDSPTAFVAWMRTMVDLYCELRVAKAVEMVQAGELDWALLDSILPVALLGPISPVLTAMAEQAQCVHEQQEEA